MQWKLEKLLAFVNDDAKLEKLLEIKHQNKLRAKEYFKETQGIELNENSIFDIQVKRLHEYKRQQLNVLYVIHKYLEIKAGKLPTTTGYGYIWSKGCTCIYDREGYYSFDPVSSGIDQQRSGSEPVSECSYGRKLQCYACRKLIPACDISETDLTCIKEASGRNMSSCDGAVLSNRRWCEC